MSGSPFYVCGRGHVTKLSWHPMPGAHRCQMNMLTPGQVFLAGQRGYQPCQKPLHQAPPDVVSAWLMAGEGPPVQMVLRQLPWPPEQASP